MSEINEFKVQQIVDNGRVIQLSLVENVQTEQISQKQMIQESISKNLDSETRGQIMPILNAILQAQPTIKIKSYQQTGINITMPRNRYERMGRPQVGQIVEVDLRKK
ncbi:conserved hypothetical protein [Cenarchaeum symbiosum A]|uniref:Uncharacterized protein n=1 Tax=Cenarchaeum symbiosum (strain A) TaxID=414004 RepID=A0RUW8_CENSY|nr:conserved hypothetical protein [Cenarchaeum symbiosum A]